MERPIARRNSIVIQKMPDEVLVYDMESGKAHCLNDTVASVWNACDGKNTISDIADTFAGNGEDNTNSDIVRLALDQLLEHNLLEQTGEITFSGSSRRELIKKIGFASVIALPVIASLTVPSTALAASSCTCVANGDCSTQTGCLSTSNCSGSICQP